MREKTEREREDMSRERAREKIGERARQKGNGKSDREIGRERKR